MSKRPRITLWSRIFKNLVNSDEECSVKLAICLISDKKEIMYWNCSSKNIKGLNWSDFLDRCTELDCYCGEDVDTLLKKAYRRHKYGHVE